ncbi:TetR family regulatory protein of MDR cluster [[Actinomadura] parvosata subsp. kistnae]|uniref:TetR/AcrR family transcriptional regulator n=1 Tax=[Actinomadura] parvosata TaxID=1955412 RepID=UPI000D269B17|nr:TetR family regulatory protein of MDR cluster [Actinomadura parvosata subsp. kistnae]
MTTTTRDRGEEQVDPRVRRTQAALRATLIELVQHRDLSRISVADVAERAGVSRSTFYDHYRDVHELAAAACTAMIDELIEAIPGRTPEAPAGHAPAAPTGPCGPGETERQGPEVPPDTLLTFFAHLAEHASLYRSVLGPQGSARVMDHLRHRATVAVYAHRTGTPPPARPRPRTTCGPLSRRAPCSASPPTGCGAAAPARPPRWPPRPCRSS